MAAEGTANVVEGETNKLSLSIRRLLSKVESPKVAPTNEIKYPMPSCLKYWDSALPKPFQTI